jgi:hypothetical protein
LLGLALRAGWIIWTQPNPASDFQVYWQYANAFYQGDLTYNVIIRHPGTILLYTYAFHLLGPSLVTGWLLNLFLSGVMMLVIYALSCILLKSCKWARVVTLLAALFPQLITYTALMATEIPGVTCTLLILWAILHSRERNDQQAWLYWVGIGELLYGTILIRSSNLIFLMLIPAVFMLTRRSELMLWAKRYAVMVATTSILLSGWVYHQYLVGGSPKLFWGDSLWMACAINYERDGGYTNPKELAFWPKVEPAFKQYEKTRDPRDEAHYYDVLGQEVLKVIKADPGKYLLHGFPRLKRTLWTSQTGLRWTERGSSTLQAVPEKLVHRMATISNVIWQILLILSPLGFLNLRRRQGVAQEGLWFILFYTTSWLLFYLLVAEANERYSFQIIPFVLMLSAASVQWLLAFVTQRFSTPKPAMNSEFATAPNL